MSGKALAAGRVSDNHTNRSMNGKALAAGGVSDNHTNRSMSGKALAAGRVSDNHTNRSMSGKALAAGRVSDNHTNRFRVRVRVPAAPEYEYEYKDKYKDKDKDKDEPGRQAESVSVLKPFCHRALIELPSPFLETITMNPRRIPSRFAFLVGISLAAVAAAQTNVAQDLHRVRRQLGQPSQTIPMRVPGQGMSTSWPSYPYHSVHYPQYPVIVTPDQYNGHNPYTGGINTKNEQVDHSYFDPYRQSSKQNGTYRFVRRPIYNTQGQIVGYQEGYVWNNSVTGVEHGELKNVTGNNQGGEHEQIQLRSIPN